MPITKFKCPVERTEVPFDHFETCDKFRGRPAFSPWMATYLAKKIQSDVRHMKLGVSASRCTACPRQTFIEHAYDYAVDPATIAVTVRGTALHEVAAKSFDTQRWYTEANDPMRMTLEGELFGTKVSALADAIKRDLTEIVDCKFPKDWSVAFRDYRKGRATPEHAIQLNVIRLLLAQQDWARKAGYDPDKVKLTIWDHGIGKASGPEPMVADHMTEAQMLAVMPWVDLRKAQAGATVQEIVAWHLWAKEAYETDETKRDAIAAGLPLVGRPWFNGDKCSSYCEVNHICERLVRVHGDPDDAPPYNPADDVGTDSLPYR